MIGITRREVITFLGGTAMAAWPIAASAQTMRRIGVLMNLTSDDPEIQVEVGAFQQRLQELGWSLGRNVQIDFRWGASDPKRIRRFAMELLELSPDVMLTQGVAIAAPLQQATRSTPIVFVNVFDPVAAGIVASLARPGGNLTGFTSDNYGISAKWLELLKQTAPSVTRAAILRDPSSPAGIGALAAIQAVAPLLRVEPSPLDVRDVGDIERGVMAFARGSNGGLIATTNTLVTTHRDLIIALAARYRLPAVYPFRYHAMSGGLISYGIDPVEPFRRAAGYIDRILRGAKPADLPVQEPTNYELVINLKTARALGLTVPPTLLATADEVIE